MVIMTVGLMSMRPVLHDNWGLMDNQIHHTVIFYEDNVWIRSIEIGLGFTALISTSFLVVDQLVRWIKEDELERKA